MLGEDSTEDEAQGAEFAETQGRGGLNDGDLEPLITEFLWEEDCAAGPEKEVLGMLVQQQKDAPVPRLDLEYLEAADLLRLLLRVYLESPPQDRRPRVERVFAAIQRFYAWAERTQDYALQGVLDECRTSFVDHLDRLHRASLSLSATAPQPSDPDRRPSLLRVSDAGPQGLELAPCDTAEAVFVSNVEATADLLCGDLVLATLERGADSTGTLHGIVVVLPAAVEILLG